MTAPPMDRVRRSPGTFVLAACVVGCATLLTHAQPNGETAYLPGDWVELVGLTVLGLALIGRVVGPVRETATSVASVVAAQLAGSATYAFKRWEPIGGFGGGVANIVLVRVLAAAMAVAMLVAGSTCVATLVREGALRVHARRPNRLVVVVVGAGLVVGLPWVLGVGGSETTDMTSLGAYALLFSLPWGVGVIGAAWLRSIPATAVLATVAVSAALLLLPARPNVVEIHNAAAGFVVLAVTTGLAVLVRILGEQARDAPLLDSPGPTAPP